MCLLSDLQNPNVDGKLVEATNFSIIGGTVILCFFTTQYF